MKLNENVEIVLISRMRNNWLKELSVWLEIDIFDKFRCKICRTHFSNNSCAFVSQECSTYKKSILVQHEDRNLNKMGLLKEKENA